MPTGNAKSRIQIQDFRSYARSGSPNGTVKGRPCEDYHKIIKDFIFHGGGGGSSDLRKEVDLQEVLTGIH